MHIHELDPITRTEACAHGETNTGPHKAFHHFPVRPHCQAGCFPVLGPEAEPGEGAPCK